MSANVELCIRFILRQVRFVSSPKKSAALNICKMLSNCLPVYLSIGSGGTIIRVTRRLPRALSQSGAKNTIALVQKVMNVHQAKVNETHVHAV